MQDIQWSLALPVEQEKVLDFLMLKCSVPVLLFLLRLFPCLLLFAFCTRDPLCIRLLRNFLLRSFFHLRSMCLSSYSILYLVLTLSQSLV